MFVNFLRGCDDGRAPTPEALGGNSVRVKLYTSTGRDRGLGGFVTEFNIPPFQLAPEMVTWGSRAFVLHEEGSEFSVYREGLLYPLLEGYTAHTP